eukprot:RCo034466
METVGSMDGGFFVGRVALLQWLNSFLQLNYDKVEQCATGVAYMQLLDALYPGEIALHRVNFDARLPHECLANFKLMQGAFNKKGITKVIPVERLLQAKYQDNLEFLQWMKSFVDKNWREGRPYDAAARKEEALGRKTGASGATSSRAT